MVFKNENTHMIGNRFRFFDLKNGHIVLTDEEMKENKNYKSFINTIEYHERILKLLLFIDNFPRIPAVYGKLFDYSVNKKTHKVKKVFRKEFFFNHIDEMDKVLRNVSGSKFIEYIILDKDIDIQSIMEYNRMRKITSSIFHLFELEDNEIYLNSKNIQRLYIPDYIFDILNK